MPWIFQGNPNVFGVDDYLTRNPKLVYWRTPKFQSEIRVGDRAFIWRAGIDSGVIAIGRVVEPPTLPDLVRHPEVLANDLWFSAKPSDDEPKTGIRPESIRLVCEEGMVSRDLVKSNPLLKNSTIIRMPQGTVFRLTDREAEILERLWGHAN